MDEYISAASASIAGQIRNAFPPPHEPFQQALEFVLLAGDPLGRHLLHRLVHCFLTNNPDVLALAPRMSVASARKWVN